MRRPPRLVARTLAVTFITVAIILSLVFIVFTVDTRDRVRAAETEKLAAPTRAGVLAIVGTDGRIFVTPGPARQRWPPGQPIQPPPAASRRSRES